MECHNLIESGKIDLQKGCPICGGKKFQYVRPKKTAPPTVAEYVAEAARREPPEPPAPAAAPEKPAAPVARPRKANATEPDRVESIRILEPGAYDINLPALLNRKALILSRDEGTYAVDLGSALKGKKKLRRKK